MKQFVLGLLATTTIAGFVTEAMAANVKTLRAPNGWVSQSGGDGNVASGTVVGYAQLFQVTQSGNNNSLVANGSTTGDSLVIVRQQAGTVYGNKATVYVNGTNYINNELNGYVTVNPSGHVDTFAISGGITEGDSSGTPFSGQFGDGNTLSIVQGTSGKATYGNNIYERQKGNNNKATINQTGNSNTSNSWQISTAKANAAGVVQEKGNTLSVTQNADSSRSYITQNGKGNSVIHDQSASNILMNSKQKGNDNYATISSTGARNQYETVQLGSGNSINSNAVLSANRKTTIVQDGTNNYVDNFQYAAYGYTGNNNSLNVRQLKDGLTANRNTVYSRQYGANNDFTVNQTRGSNNTASAYQYSKGGVVNITQLAGDNNNASISSYGIGSGYVNGEKNNANVFQFGSGNNFSVVQNGGNLNVNSNSTSLNGKKLAGPVTTYAKGQYFGSKLNLNQLNSISGIASDVDAHQLGAGNSATLTQGKLSSSSNNKIAIIQTGGTNNTVTAEQEASSNRMSIEQYGAGNAVDTYKQSGQTMKILQEGDRNLIRTKLYEIPHKGNLNSTQKGNDNILNTGGLGATNGYQEGNLNVMSIESNTNAKLTGTQVGNSNAMRVKYNVPNGEFSGLQVGNNNTMGSILSYGTNNLVRGLQRGDRNIMRLDGFEASNNKLAGEQIGNDNEMNLYLRGSGNTLTYVQNGSGLKYGTQATPVTITSTNLNMKITQNGPTNMTGAAHVGNEWMDKYNAQLSTFK